MVIRYASAQTYTGSGGRRAVLEAFGHGRAPMALRLGAVWSTLKAALRRRRLAMALAFLLPLVLAAAFQALRPGVYITSASVFVDPQLSRPGRADAAPDAGILASQLRLVTSGSVLKNAIAREKLVEDASFMVPPSGFVALVKKLLALAGLNLSMPGEDRTAAVLRLVAGAVEARTGEGANLIEIIARADQPTAAVQIANGVARAFVDELVTSADTVLGSERSRLTRRGEELKTRLHDAEMRLAQYRAQSGLDVAGKSTALESDLAAQLARARQSVSDAKVRHEQLQKHMASGKEPEVIADFVRTPSIERLKIQYTEAAAQEVSFRTSLGPRHPAYLEVLQQAREKKRLLQEGLRLALAAARIDWQSAREQEMALEKRASTEPSAMPQPQVPMQIRELEREIETAKAAYERYIRSFDAPDVSGPSVVARLVAPAPMPISASRDGQNRLWIASLAGSVVLALFAALSGFRQSPSSTAAALKRSVRWSPPARATATESEPAAPAARKPQAGPAGPTRASIAALAEHLACRTDEFPLQTVYVTAAGAGKSEAAMELARAARQQQLRVLMIDVDESAAALTEAFGHGVLAGSVMIQARPRPLIVAETAGSHRICLIPVEGRNGPVPTQPALRTLTGIAGNFDLVIIDGPVLGGTLMERKLARAAQAVMLVEDNPSVAPLQLVLRDLGVSAQTLWIVPAPQQRFSATPEARPMGVVRLKKVA